MGEAAVAIQKENTTDTAIAKNQQYSVRQFSPSSWGGFIGMGDSLGFLWPSKRDLLPTYGTLECDIALRMIHYTQQNSLVGSAVQLCVEKYLSIPHEISGGRNLTFQWQDLFADAEFGEGYDVLMSKGYVDYLTLNRGMFLELVSYGNPDTPIQEGAKILGINHLDALRVTFTGNREWPYLYLSEWGGGLHRMHRTRVIHVARQPSPNTLLFGMGKSSLYDSIGVANSQILLGRHQNELLSDLPPPGIVIFNNVKPEQVEQAMEQFEYERVRDGQNMYRAPLRMESMNPEQPSTVSFVPLATVPENFDYKQFMDIHVNMTALAFGLDPQDLWPLTGSAIGTGAQSRVLATKTDVKGPSYFANIMTPIWNFRVLPTSLEWKYKAQNPEQDRQTADIAQVWTGVVNTAAFMTTDEKRQMMANQVPAFADVLTDEKGEVRLFDDDPKTPEQVTATDEIELDTPDGTQDITMTGDNQNVVVDATLPALPNGQDKPVLPTPKQPVKQPINGQSNKPSMPTNPAVDNKFKEVQDQLKTGLLTMAQAQSAIGITPDPIYEGMYLVEGFPVPREKLRDLWQAHFGRGVASFDAVVSGETLPAGNGSGPTPEYTTKANEVIRKSIDDTDAAFVDEIKDVMQDGIAKTITKAGAAARIRGAITRYGKLAYADGLKDGCVDTDELDEDDTRIIADLNVQDSQYVTNLVDEMYSEAGMVGTPETRAPLWKSTLDKFYYAGIQSADKNGMYLFTGDDGKENCTTCAKLKGVKHRMKWWVDNELRPGIDHDNFECGTWPDHCMHYLERVGSC